MPYQHQEYPALRYAAEGRTRVVTSKDEDAQASDEGFVSHPSLIGQPKPKPAEVPKTVTPAPAADKPPKAAKTPPKPKAQKEPPAAPAAAPAPTPLETAIENAVENQPPAFDRAVAIATLEAANFEVDPATTDEELIEALAELAK